VKSRPAVALTRHGRGQRTPAARPAREHARAARRGGGRRRRSGRGARTEVGHTRTSSTAQRNNPLVCRVSARYNHGSTGSKQVYLARRRVYNHRTAHQLLIYRYSNIITNQVQTSVKLIQTVFKLTS
jgi:hypothetical protein